MRRSGIAFTLIELLVVITIIATALGMVGVMMSRTNADASVRSAAEALAGVLREARTLAMVNQAPYGVVFNIQNAPGSSGRVLNNRSGGHWYRIIGPAKHTLMDHVGRQIMVPYQWSSMTDYSGWGQNFATFPHFVEAIKDDWVSKPYVLPTRKVRFLALGETDEGNRINGGSQWGGYWTERAYGYTSTYPRPYFGYFDPVRKRLFPWGGYDPDLHTSEPWKRISGSKEPIANYSGFFYQGNEGPITDSRNPADRIRQVDWNVDKDFSDTDPVQGSEADYAVYRAGEGRPLVNADWLDSLVIFQPNGDACMPPFGVARKRYYWGQAAASPTNSREAQANGVSDRAKPWKSSVVDDYFPNQWGYSVSSDMRGYMPNYEVGDFSRVIDGWHITLAPDSADDKDTFQSAEQALKAIGPRYRIFISRRGEVQTFRVRPVGDSWLDGKPFFPSAPEFFAAKDSGGVYGDDAKRMGTTFRYGWLHLDKSSAGSALETWTPHWDLVPTGQPISRVICPRMLRDKIWWLE